MSEPTAADLVRASSDGLRSLKQHSTTTPHGEFDNRPTWANSTPAFDNRPTWDNWNKKQ
ncbi:multiple cyclophane-containing RiPP AmcA [Streptomyces cucumeris]|uniref:multiple cyclophane-containing RiPP AmcA n=1 Tax=Streptomyces cucumeris TaxID=2962890 RepID=UPI003D731ADC